MYDGLPDVASPVAGDGFVVMAASFGVVTALDAATGQVLVQHEFKTGFCASPIIAGGRLYALDRMGVMRIFSADRSLELLASPAIGEPTVATPAFRPAPSTSAATGTCSASGVPVAAPTGRARFARDVDAILASTGRERRHIVAVLSRIQDRYHYLPEEALRRVVETSGITAADIEGVSTFYARFRRKPAGRHTIRVCVGTACYVKGGENIYDAFRLALKIGDRSDTDRDGIFTVEKAACLGCCMLAPVVQIDDAVYGHLTRQTVPAVLRDFLASRAAAAGDPGPSRRAPRRAAGGTTPFPRARSPCAPARAAGHRERAPCSTPSSARRRNGGSTSRSGAAAAPGSRTALPSRRCSTPRAGRSATPGIAAADVPEILHRHFRAPGPGRRRAPVGRSAAGPARSTTPAR